MNGVHPSLSLDQWLDGETYGLVSFQAQRRSEVWIWAYMLGLRPMVFIVFNLGILGDEKTHKYPLVIGLI